jgi:uncharacterized protein (DUF433 family)
MNQPIWKSYQMIKSYYPTLEKDSIFEQLSIHFPNADPEIQSDGLYIDILWHHIVISITTDNHFSISYQSEFNYFDNVNDVIKYINDINDLYINKWIVSTVGTCSGEPRLKDTRLRVIDIVNMHKEADYPITDEQIEACFIYYEKYKDIMENYYEKIMENINMIKI